MVKNTKKDSTLLSDYINIIYFITPLLKKVSKIKDSNLIYETNLSLNFGLKYLMYAIQENNKAKKIKYLNNFIFNLDILKNLLNIAHNCNYISDYESKKYNKLFKQIELEI